MSDPSNVDSLREKLRGLGYLDAGVDRFVLAPARTGLGTWGLAWRASLRMGLLAALMIGVPATVAVATRLPTLVTGVGDSVLLASYIGIVAGAATTTVALLVLLAAARLGRGVAGRPGVAHRARQVARGAGVLVAIASLGYLTLWWRAVATTASSATFPATALALVVATVVALLLGHTTTVVALAVLSASSGSEPDPGARLQRSWKVRAVLALVTIMASATLFALAPRQPAARAADAPPVVVVPTGLRVLVVGVDGVDPEFAATLAQRESLATLGALLGGARVEMPREAGLDPVAVWMSMATAQPPERHGALGVEARRLAGLGGRIPGEARGLGATLAAATDLLRLTQPVVSSATERRERTFWELAAAAGLRTVAVNWWTTWPASAIDGVVLTERAALRLERGGPLQGEIAPPSLYESLRPQWPTIAATVASETAALTAGLAPAEAEVVTRAAGIDAVQVALATRAGLASTDLVTLYLPGVDIAQATLFSGGAAQAASSLARRVAALERVYRHLDVVIAELRRAAPDHVVVFITHPGRVRDDLPALLAISGLSPASGVALARSPARLEDVGATLLHLLGLPLSQQLTGQVRAELLPADFMHRFGPRYVTRYAERSGTAIAGISGGNTLDTEARERLRSLGYVR